MLIASKYEEMYAPEVADFVYITDNAYTLDKCKHNYETSSLTLVIQQYCLHLM
jgi:hypothetical protein